MANTYLSRTQSASNRKTFTLSYWLKSGIDGYHFTVGSDNFQVRFTSNTFFIGEYGSGSYDFRVVTNRVFRDPSAWYHIVIAFDTTQATNTNRIKIYINGVQETSFSTSDYPSQNYDSSVSTNVQHNIGVNGGVNNYFGGSMTHFHFVDGTAYPASTFGETDSTSGIWKPKTAPSVTYGTNGFFLKFENSAAMGTDSSGNSNTFAVSGTLTQNVDSPSKNYNTLSPIAYSTSGVTLSNGNTSFNSGSGVSYGFAIPSFALNKGKWYFESKIGHTCAGLYIGDTNQVVEAVRNSTRIGVGSQQYSWECNGNFQNNNSQTSYGSSAAAGNIIGMFVDLDNNKLYISINGTIQNSGTGFSITDPNSTETGFYYVGGIADQCGATANVTADMNYGGGYFGTTAVSSAQADANGEGVFEYSPNQGGASNFDSAAKNFYALNTKNIKEFG